MTANYAFKLKNGHYPAIEVMAVACGSDWITKAAGALLSLKRSQHFDTVEIISPQLHHFFTFIKVCCPVISSSIRVLDCMCKLVLNEVNALVQYFVKDGSCHSPESVRSHFPLDVT